MSWLTLISSFNDSTCISKTVDSIIDVVDKIYILDGAFTNFPSDQDNSDDGTREIIESFDSDKIVYRTCDKRYTEIQKRNLLLEYANPNIDDLIFVIDGDEYVEGNFKDGLTEAEKSESNLFNIHHLTIHVDTREFEKNFVPKLFKYQSGMKYEGCHAIMYDDMNRIYDMRLNASLQYPTLNQFEVIHLSFLRSRQRIINRKLYYKISTLGMMETGTRITVKREAN